MEHTHLVKGLDYALLQKLQTTLTTNDIVMNKLSQILSHVRAGGKKSKKEKAKKDKSGKAAKERVKPVDDSIYGEIGDYVAPITTEEKQSRSIRQRLKLARVIALFKGGGREDPWNYSSSLFCECSLRYLKGQCSNVW
ncbi:protein Red-like [Artemia franciscana]